MATVYWTPRATAVAQIADATIDNIDAGSPSASNDFTVTVGGFSVSVAGDTDAQTTAAALVADLVSSTQPYIAAIAWTAPGAGVVRGTGVAGVPFVAALSVSGAGTGAVTDFADTQAATSSHHADEPLNYSTLALPGAADDLVIADSAMSILWALDALDSTALDSVLVARSFTGRIGLDATRFATSVDSVTTDATVPEYRQDYFEISAPLVVSGRDLGVGSSTGSSRIKISNVLAAASRALVEGTAATSDGARPAFRYLVAHADAVLEVLEAPGGVGIAAELPGETATLDRVEMLGTSSASRLVIGAGAAVADYVQGIGTATIANGTAAEVRGGTLNIIGEGYGLALTVSGGRVNDRHTNSGGSEWSAIAVSGGVLDLTGSGEARTVDALTHTGGQIEADWGDLTITAHTVPSGRASINVQPQ